MTPVTQSVAVPLTDKEQGNKKTAIYICAFMEKFIRNRGTKRQQYIYAQFMEKFKMTKTQNLGTKRKLK